MISYLEGTIIHSSPSYIIVNVNGVGYKVFAVPELLGKPVGQPVKLFTYHKSTDEGQSLFGFPSASVLEFFELLLTVSGIGPKSALSIISSGEISILREAIAKQDTAFFSQMGGIGKKTAERIIVELKDKIGQLPGADSQITGSSDVFDALIGLGYATHEARRVLTELDRSLPIDQQLKQALKLLSKT